MLSGHFGVRAGTEGPGAASSKAFWEEKKASSWAHSGLQPLSSSFKRCCAWRLLHHVNQGHHSSCPNSHFPLQEVRSRVCQFFHTELDNPEALAVLRNLSTPRISFRRTVSFEERVLSASFWKPPGFCISATKSQKISCWKCILYKIQIFSVPLRKCFSGQTELCCYWCENSNKSNTIDSDSFNQDKLYK